MKSKVVPLFFFAIGLGFTGVLANLYSDAGVLYKKRPRPNQVAASAELPALGPAPTFNLTAQDGTPYASSGLLGKPWALNFFFTSCSGPCPVTMENLKSAAEQLPPGSVHLVSISVDPKNDSLEAINKYATEHGIDLQGWTLLRGPIEEVKRISEQDLKLALGDDASMHSNRIILVDPSGVIRGSYLALKEDDLARFVRDAKSLVPSRR